MQDHERCLWQERNLPALRQAGCIVVQKIPKYSPDLYAIEGWWRVLRDRLEAAAPEEIESREDFLAHLRQTVAWRNANQWEDGKHLCTNQRARALDVQELLGAKTK